MEKIFLDPVKMVKAGHRKRCGVVVVIVPRTRIPICRNGREIAKTGYRGLVHRLAGLEEPGDQLLTRCTCTSYCEACMTLSWLRGTARSRQSNLALISFFTIFFFTIFPQTAIITRRF
jgi:hypothetical protein